MVTLSEEELGRVERERAAGASAVALRLSARLVEMPVPSLSSFGAPRSVDITAEAAAITPHAMRRPRPGRTRLELGTAQDEADVRAARARLDVLAGPSARRSEWAC